jgi:hypothetical protein
MMYIAQRLARDLHEERLKRAQEERTAHQVAELRKMEKRRERAERELLYAWQRVEQLRALL